MIDMAARPVFPPYTSVVDTTIKVDSSVRDRLAVLAAERGSSIRDLVEELAAARPTREEQEMRYASALAYIREHLCPELDDNDLAAGEAFWRTLEAGGLPSPSSPEDGIRGE